MDTHRTVMTPRVLLSISLGTSLSLLGDASLYAVLPTHAEEASVSIATVGILLSVNRFVRLILNGPAGAAYDRWPRRRLFVSALFIGAISTTLYGLTRGLWPLMIARVLWGVAWVGIWIGGNKIVLDTVSHRERGRWIGIYHISFFVGAASGASLGGFLTDILGFDQAMYVNATLTFLGAIIAFAWLPETRQTLDAATLKRAAANRSEPSTSQAPNPATKPEPNNRRQFASALSLYGMHRLAMAGVLSSTFGLFLLEKLGDVAQVAGHSIGVATLTGVGLSVSTLISGLSAPVFGRISDQTDNRWQVAARGLIPGAVGFGLLAAGLPVTMAIGIPLAAISGGSNQGLSTILVGDVGDTSQQGFRLGVLFTVGDLASAVGPPLAYTLAPLIGINLVYLSIAGLFALLSITLATVSLGQ